MNKKVHKYRSSLFISSLFLVLSGGGFPKNNDSCRSYSEALATTLYRGGSVNTHLTNRKEIFAFRGGSLFASKEEEDKSEVSELNENSSSRFVRKPTIGDRTLTGKENRNIDGQSIFGSPIEDNQIIQTNYIAETNLPTDIGQFRLRAYRVREDMQELLTNIHMGTEPCVIYSSTKPPFGQKNVPVRIHDQCFTSEVFRSQR